MYVCTVCMHVTLSGRHYELAITLSVVEVVKVLSGLHEVSVSVEEELVRMNICMCMYAGL